MMQVCYKWMVFLQVALSCKTTVFHMTYRKDLVLQIN